MDFSLEDKQNYLRDEIIEEGYDGHDFFDFIKSQLNLDDSSFDISSIHMNTIKEIVAQYKEQASGDQTELSQPNIDDDYSNVVRSSITKKKENEETIECQILPPTAFSKENQVVSVIGTEKVSGYFFGSSYVLYTLSTKPVGSEVKRNYNDALWLRSRLVSLFPGLAVTK